jgi:FkbM family methyltransferase
MMNSYEIDQDPSGLFVRRGILADPYVIGEVPSYAALRIGPGDIVLDLGANIGAMSHRFLTDGADYVLAVEPFPDNVKMVELNLARFEPGRYDIIEAAVVGESTGPTLDLHTPDTNFGMISRVRHDVPYAALTGTITAKTEKFSDLVREHEPTAIKCDIEGGEIDFLDDLVALPEHVTRLAIEWHVFDEDLSGMFDKVTATDQALTLDAGFNLLATSGALHRTQHSAQLCVYAR